MSKQAENKICKAKMKLTFQLNQLTKNEQNPLLTDGVFSIMDLDDSGNLQRLEKETVDNVLSMIKQMPIYAKYYPVTMANAEDDNF